MKILISALACEPDKGSEPEVGYRSVVAASKEHDVWVLTNQANIPALRHAFDSRTGGTASSVHLSGIDFGVEGERFNRLRASGHHWYYDRWQRNAARAGTELHRTIKFDVVHHVTLASYWTRVGVAAVNAPLVLGPVGGAVNVPAGLATELGVRGTLQEAARAVARFTALQVPSIRRSQRGAALTLAQNQATARRIKTDSPVTVLSNALSVNLDGADLGGRRDKSLLFVGRLLPWKGPMLALRALRHVSDRSVILHFCGDGPDGPRLLRAAHRWGLQDRMRLHGWIPRKELLTSMAQAGAVIHPCLREEAGLSVAEALTLGTPLVFLDHGGPSELVPEWPSSPSFGIRPQKPEATAKAFGRAIEEAIESAPSPSSRTHPPTTSFEQALREAYAAAARE
jgi:glycosyltransferase involved in cell wall biosynthesis